MKNYEGSDPIIKNDSSGIKNQEKKPAKESNNRGVLTTIIISVVMLVIAGIAVFTLFNREHKKQLSILEAQKFSFTKQLTARDSVINEWMLTFDEIENNLRTIEEKENLITVNPSDKEVPKDRKKQILEEIKYINSLLDQNKTKIASLNAQLKQSGGVIKVLQSKVAKLDSLVKQSEIEITGLKTALADKNFEIGQLNSRMTGLQDSLVMKEQKITYQTDELNKAFLASGTYKELKKMGLVTREGGFLGLGRKEALMENFKDDAFSRINITETKTIPVNSKKVKLISEHPTSSYELIHDNDNKIAYIEIKDPDQFWKISKYAILEIIN